MCTQELAADLAPSEQDDGSVDFEFPIEVERMVLELCSSSKDVLRDATPPRQYADSTPLVTFPFDGPGLTLDLGLDLTGLHLADVPLSEPRAEPRIGPTKQRGPFSVQQVPVAAPPLADVAPASLPYFATFPCVPVDSGGGFGGGYVRSGPLASSGVVQADLSDGGLSFRELVVKGCLELETILRAHKQYSYIGDLLSFCHAIREASSAASLEFDAPSEETRALIIVFFRLVSCWLGMFPCQQELGAGPGHAFREWQQASRRVLVAILRRVPVLRERLQADHTAAPPWKPPSASPTCRPPWSKSHAAAASRAAKQGSAKGGWVADASLRARKGSPRGLWQADDAVLDMEEGKGLSRQAGSPRGRDTWKTVFRHSGSDGFGGLGLADPSLSMDGAFAAQPFAEPSPRKPTAMARPASIRPPTGNRKWSGGPALRGVLDQDDFHDGTYMKPGCYDVPMRRSVPPTLDGPALDFSSATINPAPPLLVSESTWQAAKASAETLCRALHAMHAPDEPSTPPVSAATPAATAPASSTTTTPAAPEHAPVAPQGVADDGGHGDGGAEQHAAPQWRLLPEAAASATDAAATSRGRGSAPDRESKGRRARQHARAGQGAGRSRSWTRSASSQPLSAPRAQLSPASARKAKAILEVLWDLQEAEDVKFTPSDGGKGGPGCVSLESMARRLKRRAYESLDQFEQDFRRALFNHTKCSGESAKVCAQRTKSLEKAFNDLLQGAECPRNTVATTASAPASTATSSTEEEAAV